MLRFFHRGMAEAGTTGHISVPDEKGRAREFPIVEGILAIPDELAHKVLGPGWEPYRGQRRLPENHEARLAELKTPKDFARHYGTAEPTPPAPGKADPKGTGKDGAKIEG